jgi:hypothetical protein
MRAARISCWLLGGSTVASAASFTAHPDWSLRTSSTTKTGPLATALTAWGCHGHANTPYTAYSLGNKGVAYSAFQDCTGEFDLQKVCIQLWYLDYYSNGHAISTMSCGPYTVSSHAYRGLFLTCSRMGTGHVRYYTKSRTYAYPDGVTHSSGGQSYAAYLC